ncbi:MAG: DUF559 domain-containing protein, partial [Firmicutes bacterium]|nr:DUF559 domain-containing protein [Bacillota bacterium]
LPENITLSELKTFVVQVLDKLDSGRKAYGILDFNVKRKKALMEIKIGGNPPTSYEDWRSIKIYLDLLISEESNLDKLNAFFGNLQVKCDIEKVGSYIDKYNLICTVVSKLNDVVTYQKDLLPDLAAGLSKIIEGDIDNIINAKEEKLEKYYTKICMKYKEIKLREAEKRVNHLHNLLINYADKINCHPTVYILLECFDKIYTNEDKIFGLWKECYCFINKLNELKPKYEELSFFVKQLSEYMPNWASKWLDKNVLEEELYPEYWMESVQFKTLQKYIHDINNKAYEISKCEKRLEELTKSIKGAKLELIVAKTKLGLLRIPDRQIEALKSWRLAVRRLGKGTGKWAWKNIKIAQEKMIEAKDAVPVWIMPLYKVSEVITSQFGSFDIVIIDEASQCDIRGLLALARGKKAVIVGDPQQISPSAVGISDAEVERLIREFLNGIPNKEHFNLKNSLYDIAEMKFTRQGTLMLKEHFRCIPEIIQFCNNLCYDNQIIPLRNVSESQRLEPVLESFFVKDGYREGGSDVNKPEAKAICERIKSIVNDRKYKEKTIGVITLQGNDQAKYIWKEINQYIDTEKQEEYKIRVGDPYNFQGDERDIIILSMVVSGNDSKNVYSLTSETYKQRFNVAVSRAKDKLILFHSIQIRDLNPVDLRFQLLNYIQNKQRDREDDDRKIEKLESPFEMEVYKWLTARGYKVEPQVKVGNCRIDMVVEGEKARLAVECDGDKYHLPEKWWEDRMRQRQLERAGWTFWRVWGSDFYKDKEAAMLPILDVLKDKGIRPVNKNNMSEENLHNNEIVNDKDYISRTHKKADLSIRNSLEEDLMEPKRKNLNRRNNLNFNWIESIEKVIIEILNESTKGKDLLPDEVMRKIEFSKRGDERSKMIKRINRVINKMIREGKIEEYSTEKRKRLRIKK